MTSEQLATIFVTPAKEALEKRKEEMIGMVGNPIQRIAIRSFWPVLLQWLPLIIKVAIEITSLFLMRKTMGELFPILKDVADKAEPNTKSACRYF